MAHFITQITDPATLAILYSASDIMIAPSRQEPFGQTLTEALASGTPVVAFNTSGPADIISHKKTGYLATPFKPRSLADGILWTLHELRSDSTLNRNARQSAVARFDHRDVARQHIDLYEAIAVK